MYIITTEPCEGKKERNYIFTEGETVKKFYAAWRAKDFIREIGLDAVKIDEADPFQKELAKIRKFRGKAEAAKASEPVSEPSTNIPVKEETPAAPSEQAETPVESQDSSSEKWAEREYTTDEGDTITIVRNGEA